MNTEELFTYIQNIDDLFDVSRSLRNREFLAVLEQATEYRRQVLDDFAELDNERKMDILKGLKNFLPLAWELYASLFNLIKEDDKMKEIVVQGIAAVAENLAHTVGSDFFEHGLQYIERSLFDLETSIRNLEGEKLRRAEILAVQRQKKETLDKEDRTIKAEMSALKNKLKERTSECDEMNTHITSLKGKIADIDTKAKNAERSCGRLARELETAQNRYQKTETQTKKLLEKKLNLDKEKEELKNIQESLKRNREYCGHLLQIGNHMKAEEIHSRLEKVHEELEVLDKKIRDHGGLEDILETAKNERKK